MAVWIKLNITKESTDLGDTFDFKIYDLSLNGIELDPVGDPEEFPMPWDAGVYIEGDKFIISGDLGQQGSHSATAVVTIPLDKVSRYLELGIYAKDEESAEELKNIFTEHHWM